MFDLNVQMAGDWFRGRFAFHKHSAWEPACICSITVSSYF